MVRNALRRVPQAPKFCLWIQSVGKRSYQITITMILLSLVLMNSVAQPAKAALPEQSSGDSRIRIGGAFVHLIASPGQVYRHTIQVANGPQALETDVRLYLRGLGQDIDGSFLALPQISDASPYSGRAWITGPDVQEMRLPPGASAESRIIISVPPDPGTDTRYASIWITSDRPASTGDNLVTYIVPIIISPKNAIVTETGEIQDLEISRSSTDQPYILKVKFVNTGNHHYRVNAEIAILGPARQVLAVLTIPGPGNSLIPTYPHRFQTSYSPGAGMDLNQITMVVKVFKDDGTLVAQREFAQPGITPTTTVTPTKTRTSAPTLTPTKTRKPKKKPPKEKASTATSTTQPNLYVLPLATQTSTIEIESTEVIETPSITPTHTVTHTATVTSVVPVTTLEPTLPAESPQVDPEETKSSGRWIALLASIAAGVAALVAFLLRRRKQALQRGELVSPVE
jgi:hypothetical protein